MLAISVCVNQNAYEDLQAAPRSTFYFHSYFPEFMYTYKKIDLPAGK